MSEPSVPLSGSYVPYRNQYYSDEAPNRLLKRILSTGFEIDKACNADVDWNEAGPRFLNIGAKIMYWYEQACRHRVGQSARDNFLAKLEKQAIYHERKKAEKDAREGAIWAAFWQEQDRLAAYHMRLWNHHKHKKRAAQVAAQERAKRVAEANERERAREVRARREAVDAKRHTEVVAPKKLGRNNLAQPIFMQRI